MWLIVTLTTNPGALPVQRWPWALCWASCWVVAKHAELQKDKCL
jgi:hypothetical protein